MHYLPDTDEKDSAAETFWPEGYKQVIRQDVYALVRRGLGKGAALRHIYQRSYSDRFSDLDGITDHVAGMVAIGAENGADDTLQETVEAFVAEASLPAPREYARYLSPRALDSETAGRLRRTVIEEYGRDDIYVYAYEAGYRQAFPGFEDFLGRVADLVTAGARNGADDMLGGIYRAFLTGLPLPPARRRPRRLKSW